MSALNPLNPVFLPRPLGLNPKNLNTGAGRAQNFSVSKLNYRKDIDNAKVSMNQISGRQSGATSSVAHIGEFKKTNPVCGSNYDAEADDKRYEYVRRLAMANRRKREAAEAASIYDTGVKTGALFKTTGVLGLRRGLIRARYQHPAAFKNLSSKDRQYFEDLIKKYVKGVPTGAGIGHHARRAMKQHILRDRRQGKVNVEDAKDFYNMIDALPKVKRGLL